MRRVLITLICIMFSMSGSLVTAAHTLAHAQSTEEILGDIACEKAHGHSAHEESSGHEVSSEHHKPSDHKGDHVAELHFTALDVVQPALDPPSLSAALKAFYSDKQQPAPVLPPDPDPDRA